MVLKNSNRSLCHIIQSIVLKNMCMFSMLVILFFPLTAIAMEKLEDFISPEQMGKSLENALYTHRAELERIKKRMKNLKDFRKSVQAEIKLYDSQNTASSEILLTSQPWVEKLENAIKNSRLSVRALSRLLEKLQKRLDSTSIFIKHTTERIELAKSQIADIRGSDIADNWKPRLLDYIQSIILILNEKKQILEAMSTTEKDLLVLINVSLEDKKAINEKLVLWLENEKKASVLNRFDSVGDLRPEAIEEELSLVLSRIRSGFDPATWKLQWMEIKIGGFDLWAIFILSLVLILALQRKFKNTLQEIEKRWEGPLYYHRRLGLFLLQRSLPYLGIALFLWICCSLQILLFNIFLGRLIYTILFVVVATRWGLDYLERGLTGTPTVLRSYVSLHIKRILYVFRATIILVFILFFVAERGSIFVWLMRSLFSGVFFIWAIVFWLKMKKILIESRRLGQELPNTKWIALLRAWTFLVIGGTLFLNLIGYRLLGGLWLEAWIKTLIILFLGYICLNAAREWREQILGEKTTEIENSQKSVDLLRWSIINLGQVVCYIGLSIGILHAWDSSGLLKVYLVNFFNYTIVMGSLKLSVKGIILAAIILFLTHFAIRICRVFLKEKILSKSNFDRGLKDSILTIITYLGWAVGLILALGIIGVNATSLTVVFGALSIGIGFGLQTIFNNFISGLILLFERPIQVGDILEIDGLRAKVKKINVRATVVQTFDNAAVIIPNSVLVSGQVTNWSFKDNRIRRRIQVGVAYGSNTELVQNTLLKIAKDRSDVLKYPKPQVIFIDHAASALIFELRVWVNADDYWIVPSRIRNDIDRRFGELGIEIAFPQMDVHIRSLPAANRSGDPDQVL